MSVFCITQMNSNRNIFCAEGWSTDKYQNPKWIILLFYSMTMNTQTYPIPKHYWKQNNIRLSLTILLFYLGTCKHIIFLFNSTEKSDLCYHGIYFFIKVIFKNSNLLFSIHICRIFFRLIFIKNTMK